MKKDDDGSESLVGIPYKTTNASMIEAAEKKSMSLNLAPPMD
jgi:hypothetical protein